MTTARKRLTDLVREEAGKNMESPPPQVPNPEPRAEVEALRARIQELETELAAQKQYVAQMKEYLDLAGQLKTELEKVKAENAQLQSQLQAQPKAPAAIAPPSVPAYRISKLARRPVGSQTEQAQANNRNIGWMD
ncbi:MAG: hypothetical protein ACUVSQ_09185 [Pseudanabaenaceae cyanobacterium]